jgi:ATP-dependent DNA helicase RecG
MTQPTPDTSLLDSLLARPEGGSFEVKRLKGGELSRCLQSLSAFANTLGGLLVLGLEDPKKATGPDRIYGVEENPEALDELRRQLQTLLTPRIQPPWAPEPVFHTIPCVLRTGSPGTLVCIQVYPSETLHSLVTGGTFVRFDRSNRQLNAGEIHERMLRLGQASVVDQPVEVPFELLDTHWWKDYRDARGLTRPLEEALRSVGLAKKVGEAWKPTRLAVLLFAEFPSDLLGEKCAIRIFHYQGEQVIHTGSTTNLLRPPRTVTGPLVHQIREGLRGVEEELASGVQVSPLGFEIVQRYPRRAIQESITNAVLHRDYRIPGDIQIRLFSDRIEVESPGGLPYRLQVTNLGKVGSRPRNPSLVNQVREFPSPPNQDAGEGIPMMRDLMRKADLYPPIFVPLSVAEKDSLLVTLRNEVRASNWDQVAALLDSHSTITNTQVRELLGTEDTLRVSKLLRGWVEIGLLEVANPEGAKQNRRYRKPGTAAEVDLFSTMGGNEGGQND